MIAENLESFVNIGISGITNYITTNKTGRRLIAELRFQKLRENPNMTDEEWEEVKQQFLFFLFSQAMENDEKLRKEYLMHIDNAMEECK